MSHGLIQPPRTFAIVCGNPACKRPFVAHSPKQLECDPCRWARARGER